MALIGYTDNDRVHLSEVKLFNGNISKKHLLKYYDTRHQVKKLIDLGDIAYLTEIPSEATKTGQPTKTVQRKDFELTMPDYTGRYFEILLFDKDTWVQIHPGLDGVIVEAMEH